MDPRLDFKAIIGPDYNAATKKKSASEKPDEQATSSNKTNKFKNVGTQTEINGNFVKNASTQTTEIKTESDFSS